MPSPETSPSVPQFEMPRGLPQLFERIEKYRALQLPGQPRSMHMGTSYLITDLAVLVKTIPTMVEHIWRLRQERDERVSVELLNVERETGDCIRSDNDHLRALNAELLAACRKLEEAETFHANCEECEGEGIPELCEACFPLFDDARCMRRDAIAKATGGAS